MKFIGVPLRRPDFNELTAAAVMGSGLWVLAIGLMHFVRMDITKGDAGALLLVMLWSCTSTRLGIRVGAGSRHLAANVLGAALILALYEAFRTMI